MERDLSMYLESKERITPLTYHHTRPLESIVYGKVQQRSPIEFATDDTMDVAEMFDGAYKWLENNLGFYPLFMAVGRTGEDVRMTGYQNQWRRKRVMQEKSNEVLFSYRQKPDMGKFMDYDYWHIILNNYRVEKDSKDWATLFRPSFIKHDWVSYANKHPHSVQLVVPELDLTIADQITVRNEKTKVDMLNMGFRNIVVARLKVN